MQEKRKMFGQILKEYRIKKGISQSNLAKMIGISATTIFLWEVGKRIPSELKMEQVERFMRENQ